MARKIIVKVEMEFVEGRDFPASNSDQFAIVAAEGKFVDILTNAEWEPFDWIQTKLIEESDNA